MSNYRDTLDELFVSKLGFEYSGTALPIPEIPSKENILRISKEYSANGIDVIVTECKDRIPEFQKQVIKAHKKHFPNSHFLFISNKGKVFDLYNVSTSKKLKPITYNEIERNTRLFKEKIQLFNVDESQGTVDLKIKIEKAFDTNDKVTKKFFDHFEKIHKKLQSAITGIKDKDDVSWYASVLLNRIMFIYFLQKHFVIQNDPKFLITKFDEVEKNGKDYYKDFLLPLFFVGFAKRDTHPEKKAFISKYGSVKYLNGGLFYPHHIEEKYSKIKVCKEENGEAIHDIVEPNIEVDSKILKEILIFLDGYTWYLDSRPMKDEKDINPDVLGYIFEKYINQKELGAYYTKEDITEYIAKNTIIPFILEKLRTNGFNAPEPNKLITENHIGNPKNNILLDYIEECEDYETLKYIYKDILLPLSVLDPSVGSGAFLFAALNILLPVYQKIVFKLKQFHNRHEDDWLKTLCSTLELHSEEYFLTKQIILNNLFGVDIVEEATEICKLRLFLQLASHLPDIQAIEPLPDIDFNIYAGNSLVGGLSWNDLQSTYAMKLFDKEGEKINLEKIKSDISKLSEKKKGYRMKQQEDSEETDLKNLKTEINKLELKINYAIDIGVQNPLHWFIEYNDIIAKGGFDVIIGNPPYVEYSDARKNYLIKGYQTISTGNLYSFMMERSDKLSNNLTYNSFIVPVSIICTDRMETIQSYLLKQFDKLWVSSFAERPSKLFEGAERNVSILIYHRLRNQVHQAKILSTNYIKWHAEERPNLFDSIQYNDITNLNTDTVIPKLGTKIENSIWEKIGKIKSQIANNLSQRPTEHKIMYRNSGGRYWKIITDFTPYFTIDGKQQISSRESYLYAQNKELKYSVIGALNSSTYFWWYVQNSDTRTNNPSHLKKFPINFNAIDTRKLLQLSVGLMKDYNSNAAIKTKNQKTGFTEYAEYYPRLSKSIIDEIDFLLSEHYGFTEEEAEFITNYDLKFRMGGEEEE